MENLIIHCNDCGEKSCCTLDGINLCLDCLNDRLNDIWNDLRTEEKADALGFSLNWTD